MKTFLLNKSANSEFTTLGSDWYWGARERSDKQQLRRDKTEELDLQVTYVNFLGRFPPRSLSIHVHDLYGKISVTRTSTVKSKNETRKNVSTTLNRFANASSIQSLHYLCMGIVLVHFLRRLLRAPTCTMFQFPVCFQITWMGHAEVNCYLFHWLFAMYMFRQHLPEEHGSRKAIKRNRTRPS